ncbi:MAG: SDR family NAD(P)-dependent oxidoreductase [Armatimonadota bacterium]
MEFSGKTAIITGAASGMGLLSAQRLAALGANVVLIDVNQDAAEAAAQEIRQNGGEVTAFAVDVRDYTQVRAASEHAHERYGRIDILINCAGGASSRVFGRTEEFKDLDINIIDWGIDVNLKGPIYFSHTVIGYMMEQKSGVIIYLGSIEGETGSYSIEYGACKSALMYGLTKSMALYGAPYGVRVCCVSPGPVLTRPAMANMKTALGRAAQPGEIVDLILYLCSEKAAFITGVNYLIDGGRNIGPGTDRYKVS